MKCANNLFEEGVLFDHIKKYVYGCFSAFCHVMLSWPLLVMIMLSGCIIIMAC